MWQAIYFEGLSFLAIQHFLGIIMPGPCMAIVIKNSIDSRRKGVMTVLGSVCGSFSVKTLSILGFAFILSQVPMVFNIFKVAGGLYLILLGYTSFKSAWENWKHYTKRTIHNVSLHVPSPILKIFKNLTSPFLTGFLVSFSNPLGSIRFLAIFSTAITPDMPLLLQLSYPVVLAMISLAFYGVLSFFFSEGNIQPVLRRYRFILDTLLGLTMIYWGIKVFQVTLQ